MANKLDPITPGMGDTWDAAKAAHLMRRAGFGATPAEITALVGSGSAVDFNAAVDALVDYDPSDDSDMQARLGAFAAAQAGGMSVVATPVAPRHLEAHWYFRMHFTTRPLQEQLTLFWHDHFATEYQKIKMRVNFAGDPFAAEVAKAIEILLTQNNLFRAEGMDDFRTLLIDETRDPAMLLYLDNWQNVKDRPQENFARELMELFSTGPEPYSEDEVRDVARALTGESLDEGGSAAVYNYLYRQNVHDVDLATPKFLFGARIDDFGDDRDTGLVIDTILGHTASADFMARKLLTWFVHPNPDPIALGEFAAELRTNGFVFREALRKLFKSLYFYESQNYWAIYRTPIDYAIHFLHQLSFTKTELLSDAHWTGLAVLTELMGMRVYYPPNVGGWIQGEAWINSVNLINRYNYAERVARSDILLEPLAQSYVADFTTATNSEIREVLRERIVQEPLGGGEEAILDAHLAFIDGLGASVSGTYYLKVVGMAHLMASLPRTQLK